MVELPVDLHSNIVFRLRLFDLISTIPLINKHFSILVMNSNELWREKTRLHFPKIYQLIYHYENLNWNAVFRAFAIMLEVKNITYPDMNDPAYQFINNLIPSINYIFSKIIKMSSFDELNIQSSKYRKWLRNLQLLMNENDVISFQNKFETMHKNELKKFIQDDSRTVFDNIIFYKAIKMGNPVFLEILKNVYLSAYTRHLKKAHKFVTNKYIWDILEVKSDGNAIIEKIQAYKSSDGRDISTVRKICSSHLAARFGYLNIFKFYFENPYFEPKIDSRNRSSLHYAAAYGHFEIVKYIVEKYGIHYSLACKPPVYYAAKNGYFDIVKYLVENKNPKFQEDFKSSFDVGRQRYVTKNPMVIAYINGHREIGDYLQDKIIFTIDNDFELLFFAIQNNSADAVKHIIQVVQYTVFDLDKILQIYYFAQAMYNKEIVEHIASFYYLQIKSHEVLFDPEKLLCQSIQMDNHHALEYILMKTCRQINFSIGLSPYQIKATEEYNFRYYEAWDNTPLTFAIINNATKCVSFLVLKKKADPNYANPSGKLPLILAVQNDVNPNIVRALLAANANPFLFDKDNNNPIVQSILLEKEGIYNEFISYLYKLESDTDVKRIVEFFQRCIKNDLSWIIHYLLIENRHKYYKAMIEAIKILNDPGILVFAVDYQLPLSEPMKKVEPIETIGIFNHKRSFENLSITVPSAKRLKKSEEKYENPIYPSINQAAYHLTLLPFSDNVDLPEAHQLKKMSYTFPVLIKHQGDFYYGGYTQSGDFKILPLKKTLLSLQYLNFIRHYKISVSPWAYGDIYCELNTLLGQSSAHKFAESKSLSFSKNFSQ